MKVALAKDPELFGFYPPAGTLVIHPGAIVAAGVVTVLLIAALASGWTFNVRSKRKSSVR